MRFESKHEYYISVLYPENVNENIRPISFPLSCDEVSHMLSRAEWLEWYLETYVKFYLCGLKTGQSSPYQLQIPKPVTEHRIISFTNTALLICYQYHKTQERILISQCICKNLECCFKVKAESTYMQHKQTTQYFTTAADMEQKWHWQQHQKNRALDPQARVHLGIKTERLVH